ncbi:hypothetical protein [Quadrisphaera sp. KR29]|uniref:hypothetical protein n=1 Tax=Quadrisphaera sp. KR29 TaxID=3461391 RepID=UPI004043B66C
MSHRRGRSLRLLPHPGLGELSGTWVALDDGDVVFYDEALHGMYREHVIAHELAHIAFGHGHDEVVAPDVIAALFPDLDPRTVRRMLRRGAYSDTEEREAEVFASMLLQRSAGRRLGDLPDPVPERAAGIAGTFGSRRDGPR